jgi:hypothetical protein
MMHGRQSMIHGHGQGMEHCCYEWIPVFYEPFKTCSQFAQIIVDIEGCHWFELQESVAGAKFSVSIPYVTVASDKASVAEALVSHKVLSRALKIGDVAVSGSCSVGMHDVKKLTDVPDILVIMCNSNFMMRGLLSVLVFQQAIVLLEVHRMVHVVCGWFHFHITIM